MLAALLANLPQGGIADDWRKTGIIDGRFYIGRNGEVFDLEEDEPDTKVVKKIVRALRKITLPKIEEQEVQQISRKLVTPKRTPLRPIKRDAKDHAQRLADFRRLVAILKRAAQEEEEMALLMLLLEID